MPRKSKDELNKQDNQIIEITESKVNSAKATKKSAKSGAAKKVAKSKTAASKATASKEAKSNAKTKSTAKTAKKEAANTTSKATKAKKETTNSTSKAKVAKSSSSKSMAAKKTTIRSSSTKSATSKKATTKKATTKKATTKKATTKKATTKKATTSKSATSAKAKKGSNSIDAKTFLSSVEYYDLPYRYNETTVKILAQTPTTLFIYWDISDADRASYSEKYGDDFFNNTKPVLVVTNKTMNYSFEVEINDFANSWYLHVNDADCDYVVELGRRPIYANTNIDNFVHVSNSNDMEMPNNHILFDRLGKSVFFRNIKNNFVEEKEISSLSFIKNIGKLYDVYEIYKELYEGEISIDELYKENIKLNLSSSNSSTFK